MHLPLAGITVVELGANVAGPFGTWILAQLGAEVVKVERPEGDDARGWGPPFAGGVATLFHALNRGKRSLAVDLKDPRQVAQVRTLILDRADVVLQNLRPGAVGRLGLDAASLRAAKPALIYCNLHAFGATGPLAERPGYDALMQAFSGIMSVTGEAEGAPVRCGISVCDMGTGMWCAIGVLAALCRRQATGEGGVVDASLYETALAWMTFYLADVQVTGQAPQRLGSGVRGIAPYQGYACADGELVIAASNDRLFAKLAAALGRPEWLADPRFSRNEARASHRVDLNAALTDVLGRQTRAYWQERLLAAGVPCAPVQDALEVIDHPQTAALAMMQPGEPLRLAGLPLSFEGERPGPCGGTPALGADNALLGMQRGDEA